MWKLGKDPHSQIGIHSRQGPVSSKPTNTTACMACRQKCLSLAWCLQRAFNKCLLKPAELPGSSTPIPYFPQVESEQGVSDSPAWPKQDPCMNRWKTLVFSEKAWLSILETSDPARARAWLSSRAGERMRQSLYTAPGYVVTGQRQQARSHPHT